MNISEKIVNKIHGISTGDNTKRVVLTPIVGGIFTIVTTLFIIIPFWIDKFFNLPLLPYSAFSHDVSLALITFGIILMIWTNAYFIINLRTPVPVNPPERLITKGPYSYIRNPMHLGLFILMFGIGFYNGSILSLLIFTPLYILIDIKILKTIEEPELEKRLGEDYLEYKKRVPMFFPW
ncbi:MAG TPA: isoprenylcysteine carboxylmethyltransferase family protein [Ignavibacteria bacterium]|jgi:protein-S-isoprenylcysteine O-methyltransferase Ste14